MHPTETDSLLPTPRKSPGYDHSRSINHRKFIKGIIAAGVIGVLCLFILQRQYKPNKQISQLNKLTHSVLAPILESPRPLLGRPKNKQGKMIILKDQDISPNVYHCTSTLIIMRHCDKGITIKSHGHEYQVDSEDDDGDRHCNAKGKARSAYIAGLFVDPTNYEHLVENLGRSKTSSIPPVPMIASSLKRSMGNRPARKKPQFPAPLKLYALNDSRHQHRNYREVETITPLADKFHLDVDERFGVFEEEDLAMDYFESLSESLLSNVQRLTRRKKHTEASQNTKYNAQDESTSDTNNLCEQGMTVVNWKHSRIPALARAFGCGRDEGCPQKYYSNDFDTLWMVTFQYSVQLYDDVHVRSIQMESSPKQRHSFYGLKRMHDVNNFDNGGSWKVSAQLINEGFDPVFT